MLPVIFNNSAFIRIFVYLSRSGCSYSVNKKTDSSVAAESFAESRDTFSHSGLCLQFESFDLSFLAVIRVCSRNIRFNISDARQTF